jgi:phosphoglucosamine mutase
MSNLGLRLAMQRAGIRVVETGVGDRYVLEALNDGGYSLGGEQSGHIIIPALATTGRTVCSAGSCASRTTCAAAGRPRELAHAAMTRSAGARERAGGDVTRVADELAAEIAAEEAMAARGGCCPRQRRAAGAVRDGRGATSEQAQRVAALAAVVEARWAAAAPPSLTPHVRHHRDPPVLERALPSTRAADAAPQAATPPISPDAAEHLVAVDRLLHGRPGCRR